MDKENFKPASRNKRLANAIVDGFSGRIFSAMLGMAFLLFFNNAISQFSFLFYGFIFYFLFEYFFQKTPAKWITKTKVVSLDGKKPTKKQILIRTIIRVVPFEALSFLNNKNPFGWHDRWSKTTVVPDYYTEENVKSIDWVELKKNNKRSIAFVAIMTLIVLAVLGIVASFILGSMVKARESAKYKIETQHQNL